MDNLTGQRGRELRPDYLFFEFLTIRCRWMHVATPCLTAVGDRAVF